MVAVIITATLLGIVELADYVTGPFIDLAIAYFIPIIYAAWALGRGLAFPTILLAEVTTYFDQRELVRVGELSPLVAVSNIIARFFVFVFVVEVTRRLISSREHMRRTAENLRATGEKLREAYESIDADIKAAGLLQSSVLDFDLPDIPGLQIGTSIKYAGSTGGDFADAGILDDRIYACVADVSGKGVPAALFTTLLKYLLMEAHDLGLRSVDAIMYINRGLSRMFTPEYFVTLFYLEIEPSTGRVEYVNAGHPEGLIYHTETEGLELASPTTGLLGVSDDLRVNMRELILHGGDSLVMYTDGATDSRTPEGARLGEQAILDLTMRYHNLPAQDMANSIREGIEAATDPDLRDDLVVICVKSSPTS